MESHRCVHKQKWRQTCVGSPLQARELEPDDSPPLQSDTQVVGSQHEQSLSPAWETLLAGIITVKTLQKTVQSRRPSTHTACPSIVSTGTDLPFRHALRCGLCVWLGNCSSSIAVTHAYLYPGSGAAVLTIGVNSQATYAVRSC